MQTKLSETLAKAFPLEIRPLNDEVQKKVNAGFPAQTSKLVQVGPEKWLLPDKFESFADEIRNFKVRPDDVFISTFARSGTTWTQEMIWLLCNDLDYETARKVALTKRFPFMDMHLHKMLKLIPKAEEVEDLDGKFEAIYDYLNKQTTRRFIKTHLPMALLPKNIKEVGAKVVYVARNPEDVAVSYYYFQSLPFFGFAGSFKEYVEFFMNDLTVYAPYWEHVLEGWHHRHDENVHFMFYEDSKFNLETALRKLAKFLDKPLNDEDLPKLMNHLHFDNARNNTAINFQRDIEDNKNHIRRGQVGGNPEMTEDISTKFDKWTEERLKGIDLKFPTAPKG